MDRIAAIQRVLGSVSDATYLEIGVCTGESFIPIRAKRKWGVDPGYVLSWRRRLKYAVFSFLGIKVERLFRMTSDEFFATKKEMVESHGIDVCFVDGLHTYEQALKDALNALEYLKPGGVILIHDCSPTSAVMALPSASIETVGQANLPGWNGAWCGDIWKAIVHLRSLRQDLISFVLDCDNGIGVVTRGAAATRLSYSEADIRAMDYEVLAANRKDLLDLRPPEYLDEFLHKQGRRA
jgi:Methyltransferase domain